MTKKQPKQLVNSEYERRENDAYYTDPWVTRALLRRFGPVRTLGDVCDPAAGRGDILKAVDDAGYTGFVPKLYGYDIAAPRKRVWKGKILNQDYLDPAFELPPYIDTVITNPPFGDLAQKFVVKTLVNPNIRRAAFLLRCNWNTSAGRKDSRRRLFDRSRPDLIPFAYEIILTERPRWDWWYVTEEQSKDNNKPFHSYSWFVWDRSWKGPSTQFWEGRQ